MRDTMSKLVDLLRQLADVLQPFVGSHRAGDRVWDGREWAPTTEPREGDSGAHGWWISAITAAGLLDGQPSLTPQQNEFLRRELFGGMGSLQDFSLDRRRWGEKANEANRQLEIIRTALYGCLQTLAPHDTRA